MTGKQEFGKEKFFGLTHVKVPVAENFVIATRDDLTKLGLLKEGEVGEEPGNYLTSVWIVVHSDKHFEEPVWLYSLNKELILDLIKSLQSISPEITLTIQATPSGFGHILNLY